MESNLQVWIDKDLHPKARKIISKAALKYMEMGNAITFVPFTSDTPPANLLAAGEGHALIMSSSATFAQDQGENMPGVTFDSADAWRNLDEDSDRRSFMKLLWAERILIGQECDRGACIPPVFGPGSPIPIPVPVGGGVADPSPDHH